ncbi:MAG: prolyl oligopeptidase family serine peptidase [Planctomycetota bacterium]|nr:prolyl oligopeptidase family serine peptidase [Planctomycetota bacterium]
MNTLRSSFTFVPQRGCPAVAVALVYLAVFATQFVGGLTTSVAAEDVVYEGLTPHEADELKTAVAELEQRLIPLWKGAGGAAERDRVADAALFPKAVAWALRYDRKFEPADVQLMRGAVAKAKERIDALEKRELPWSQRTGRLVRGYQSEVDGSVQPFGLVIPKSVGAGRPWRLDVVLHGSTRPVGMSELRFASRFAETPPGQPGPPDEPYIELHPLGRVENCYRWAGETDVFEAIEAVCRQYPIDRDRIVLRGMSMGASGTWHLGLKHPERFVAPGPYCGYVDTHKFSETPLSTFIRVGPLPEHQERGLHMLDSVDYAANASVVPAIACIGAKDVFFDAHVIMGHAFRREGLQLINLVSPDTGHTIDPVTQREQLRLIGAFADRGVDRLPMNLRFVTWTLKYNRCHWVELLSLGEHYARAEFDARRSADGLINVVRSTNILRFALAADVVTGERPRVRFGELEIDLSNHRDRRVELANVAGRWQVVAPETFSATVAKRPGLQGPIDDAFATPFLCVRGTGTPWNPAVHEWSMATLDRFAREWDHYLRGELRIIDDVDVSAADREKYHLVLFGDPGSNRLIAKALPKLPIQWTRENLVMGDEKFPAADHSPALIYPSPLTATAKRYVVINSGHTFHEPEFSTLNYLLFPRLGDWGVIQVGVAAPGGGVVPGGLAEQVKEAGFFDEEWKFLKEPEEE